MGELRVPKSTEKKLEEIAKEANPKKALTGIVDLFNNYIPKEEEVVARYSQRTGKPVKNRWKKSRSYSSNEEIPVSDNQTLDFGEPEINKSVAKFIKQKGPVLINTRFGKYVFTYHEVEVGVDSGRMGDPGGSETGYSILVSKVMSEL